MPSRPRAPAPVVSLTRPSVRLAAARAHRWREDFQDFYDQPAEQAEAHLTP